MPKEVRCGKFRACLALVRGLLFSGSVSDLLLDSNSRICAPKPYIPLAGYRTFPAKLAFSPSSSLFSSMENEDSDSARPGDERFRKLSNEVQGPLWRSPCHHTRDRQLPEPCLSSGEAPCRLAALACRTESPDHTLAKGSSDASKTQLGLIGSCVTSLRDMSTSRRTRGLPLSR